MASKDMKIIKKVLKEGVIKKKSSLLKQWRQRFLVLNRETLCVFKKEGDVKSGRTAKERIFLMDITSLDKYSTKKKTYCIGLVADSRTFHFSCGSEIDQELWIRAIRTARDHEKRLEENDPIRRKSMKLTGGLKRITIEREKGSGLGCTIKNVGGVIFVNRILEHGTVSSSGVLRPGDQLLDVNGIELADRTVAEISEIIRSSPEQVVCTVKPATDFRVVDTHATPRTADYAEIDLSSLKLRGSSSSGSEESLDNSSCFQSGNENPELTDENRLSHENTYPKLTERSNGDHEYDDVIPRHFPKRHSLPSSSAVPGQGKSAGEDMQYLELDFPIYDRPRVKSDASAKSSKNKPVQPIAAYAYIELDFKGGPEDAGTRPSSLPRNIDMENMREEKRRSTTLPE